MRSYSVIEGLNVLKNKAIGLIIVCDCKPIKRLCRRKNYAEV